MVVLAWVVGCGTEPVERCEAVWHDVTANIGACQMVVQTYMPSSLLLDDQILWHLSLQNNDLLTKWQYCVILLLPEQLTLKQDKPSTSK